MPKPSTLCRCWVAWPSRFASWYYIHLRWHPNPTTSCELSRERIHHWKYSRSFYQAFIYSFTCANMHARANMPRAKTPLIADESAFASICTMKHPMSHPCTLSPTPNRQTKACSVQLSSASRISSRLEIKTSTSGNGKSKRQQQ
jgi:hypothetical protein